MPGKRNRKIGCEKSSCADERISTVDEVKYSRIIRYIDDTTLEKSNDKKKDKQESTSATPEEVQEFVNLTITEHMGKHIQNGS